MHHFSRILRLDFSSVLSKALRNHSKYGRPKVLKHSIYAPWSLPTVCIDIVLFYRSKTILLNILVQMILFSCLTPVHALHFCKKCIPKSKRKISQASTGWDENNPRHFCDEHKIPKIWLINNWNQAWTSNILQTLDWEWDFESLSGESKQLLSRNVTPPHDSMYIRTVSTCLICWTGLN